MVDLIKELKKDRGKLASSSEKISEILIEKCLQLIRNTNLYGETTCIYEIPVIVSGYPLYDVEVVTKKLIKKIKKHGLKVNYRYPNNLIISW